MAWGAVIIDWVFSNIDEFFHHDAQMAVMMWPAALLSLFCAVVSLIGSPLAFSCAYKANRPWLAVYAGVCLLVGFVEFLRMMLF